MPKKPEDRCEGWKGQCQGRLIKNAPESILLRTWKHKGWALVVYMVPRSLMVWGSCRPSLLSRDPRGRGEDLNQLVAKMSSCTVMLSKNTSEGKTGIFLFHVSKHFSMKINDRPSRDRTTQVFHSFSSENLSSLLLTWKVFPLLQQLWKLIMHQAGFPWKLVQKVWANPWYPAFKWGPWALMIIEKVVCSLAH